MKMSKIYFVILLFFIKVNNLYVANDNNREINYKNFSANTSESFFLKYLYQTNFTLLGGVENSSLQVNIHSINCKINVDFDGAIISQNDSEIFSLLIYF